jgi:hypothetical protein
MSKSHMIADTYRQWAAFEKKTAEFLESIANSEVAENNGAWAKYAANRRKRVASYEQRAEQFDKVGTGEGAETKKLMAALTPEKRAEMLEMLRALAAETEDVE